METNNSTELINQLSDEFSRLIVEEFTADQLKEVIEKNASEAYKNCCATHDYFDANEFMAEAFQNVTGHEIDVQDGSNIDLWNAAWALSKSLDFAVVPCMSDLDENGDIAPYSELEIQLKKFNDYELKELFKTGFFETEKEYTYTLEKGPDQYNPCLELHIIEGGALWHTIQYFGKRKDAEQDIKLLQSLGVNIDEE